MIMRSAWLEKANCLRKYFGIFINVYWRLLQKHGIIKGKTTGCDNASNIKEINMK